MQTSDVNLRLPSTFAAKVDAEIIRRVRATVSHCKERDNILRGYADQADGLSQPFNDGPWSNSCELEDPMTDEHCTQLTAYLMANLRTEPGCMIEAVVPGEEDAAKSLENALSVKCQQWNVPSKMHDVVYNAVRFPYAPAAISWSQELKHTRSMQDVDPATGQPINPYLQDAQNQPSAVDETEGTNLQPQPVPSESAPFEKWEVVSQGPEVRAISPDDFYLYPPLSQDIDKAQQICERVYFTAEELYMGVDKFGWDADEVEDLIRMGGTDAPSQESITGSENEMDGIGSDYEDALFECFIVTGRMPLLFDSGRCETPQQYLLEDFLWMVCPDRNVIFHFGSCPYTVRPYTVYSISRKPGRMMGKCVPGYLETLQEEATANLRFKIDILNLIANPVLKVPNDYDDLDGDEMFPGKKLRYQKGPQEIEALQQNFAGWEALTGQQQELIARADKLMSAPGADQVETRSAGPLTATQSGMIGQSLSMKRDMFLQTFQEGNQRFYQLLVAIWLQHMPDDGEEVPSNGDAVTVTTDDLEKRYRFIPHANSDATNPQQRLQMTQARQAAQLQYINGMMTLPPQFWPLLYHGARRFLQDTGERNVEAWIGKEPTGIDPQQVVMQLIQLVGPLVQRDAQLGDQMAMMIGQQIGQLVQASQPLGAQPQNAPPGIGGQGQGIPQLPSGQGQQQAAQMNGVH